MKVYIKIFIVAFVAFTSIMAGAYYALDTHYDPLPSQVADNDNSEDNNNSNIDNDNNTEPTDPVEIDNRTELEKLADESNRINIIAFGLNDYLADTMMFISFDPETADVDIVSIPRDTYYPVEGFNDPTQKKINAVYSFKEVGGSNGMKKYISEFLGVPIDYYVRVDFKAVEAVVDVLGGYQVTVPYDMDYDDDWANPPLHIHLKKGSQVLSGAETVKFLRFRKNNDHTIQEGDVQRIPRQQRFVSTMIKKALSSKLPSVINTVMKYVKTDMTLEQALGYAVQAAGMQSEDITFYTVEGEDKMMNSLSYWIHDPAKLEELLTSIYQGDDIEETTEETN